MSQKLKTDSRFIKKLIALLIGLLMNPILLTIIFFVDSASSNEMYSKSLLERTPFAYSYFWPGVFLPGNPPDLEAEMLLALIGNTILYAALSYGLLGLLEGNNMNLSSKGLIAGFIYAVIYWLIAAIAAGAGHGTNIFFAASFPFGLGLLFFPILGFLADNLDSFFMKVLFLITLAIHYGLAITYLKVIWLEDLSYFKQVWTLSPFLIIPPAGFYLLGNLTVYRCFIQSLTGSQKAIHDIRLVDISEIAAASERAETG